MWRKEGTLGGHVAVEGRVHGPTQAHDATPLATVLRAHLPETQLNIRYVSLEFPILLAYD